MNSSSSLASSFPTARCVEQALLCRPPADHAAPVAGRHHLQSGGSLPSPPRQRWDQRSWCCRCLRRQRHREEADAPRHQAHRCGKTPAGKRPSHSTRARWPCASSAAGTSAKQTQAIPCTTTAAGNSTSLPGCMLHPAAAAIHRTVSRASVKRTEAQPLKERPTGRSERARAHRSHVIADQRPRPHSSPQPAGTRAEWMSTPADADKPPVRAGGESKAAGRARGARGLARWPRTS